MDMLIEHVPLKAQESVSSARLLAAKLRRAILAVPAESLIGKEDGLCRKYDCTRAMLRQAARLLEHQELLRVRRGPGGGYYGTRPSMRTVVEVSATYFAARGTTLGEAMIAAISFSVEAVRLAALAAPKHRGRQRMRTLFNELSTLIPEDTSSDAFIAQEEQIIDAIFALVGSTPLEVMAKVLNRLALDAYGNALFVRQPERRKVYRDMRLRTLQAILDQDPTSAVASMQEVNKLVDKWVTPEARASKIYDMRVS